MLRRTSLAVVTLRRARTALRDVAEFERPEDVVVSREYQRDHAEDRDVVALFAERVAGYKATATVVTPAAARLYWPEGCWTTVSAISSSQRASLRVFSPPCGVQR